MTRGIFIAGTESSLFSAAAAEAAKRVEAFACTLLPNRLSALSDMGHMPSGRDIQMPALELPGGAVPLSWNPASPISARTLVLAAENRLKQINDAIIICSPPAIYKTAAALMPEEIEMMVNNHIKGWFFLVRELILYFRRISSGTLSFVVPDETGIGVKNTPAELLGSSAAASFRTFAQGILSSQANEPFPLMGFSGTDAGAEADFAAWFFRIIDERAKKNSGRWNKYSRLTFLR